MTLRKRFRGVIRRMGDPIEVASSPTTGVLTVLDADGARALLTEAELAATGRPLYLAYVPYDAPATVGDSAVTPDGNLDVLRTLDLRFQQETFARLLVLAPA